MARTTFELHGADASSNAADATRIERGDRLTMTVIALGLATAAAYGASDFLGGLASRRSESSLAVVALLKVTTLVVFLAGMPLAQEAPNVAAVTWGGLAGLALALGYIAYFHGLTVGRMGMVSTLTAVWSAVVPLAVGLLLGERPSALTWTGLCVILLAIVLITYTRARSQAVPAPSAPAPAPAPVGAQCLIHCAGTDPPLPEAAPPPALLVPSGTIFSPGVLEATLAGIMFAMFFVALERAGAATGGHALAWPLLASAVSAAILVGAVAAIRGVAWRAALRQAPGVVVAGALYAAGSWAFILGVSRGWISIIAVIAALSPAPTMLLARLFLAESLSTRQLAGVLLALLGLVLVTVGLNH